MTNPAPHDLRAELTSFVNWRKAYLSGDEKGQAQVFCERLFKAFGHPGLHEVGAVLEARLRTQNSKATSFADLLWKPRVLIEMKKAGTDLSRHYAQAFQYWIQAVPNRPRYVVLCNFDELWVYDFENQMDAPVDIVTLDDLPDRWDALPSGPATDPGLVDDRGRRVNAPESPAHPQEESRAVRCAEQRRVSAWTPARTCARRVPRRPDVGGRS